MLKASVLTAILWLGAPAPLPYDGFTAVGSANYWLGPFKLYRATLLSPTASFDANSPYALKLEYSRSIPATKIANATIIEMARLSNQPEDTYDGMRGELETCFGDVDKGDVITGYKRSENVTEFTLNGTLRCTIDKPNFSAHFFAIWLDPAGRYPKKTSDLTKTAG